MNPLEIGTIPRLYTALAEWMACVVYILQFRRRLRGAKLIGVMLSFLVAQGALMYFTSDVPLGLWVPCMIAAIGLMFAFIATCCDITLLDAGYTCVRAFVLAEFAASLEWQLVQYGAVTSSGEEDPTERTIILVFLMLLTYLILFGLMYYIESRNSMKDRVLNVRWQELGLAVVIGTSVFLMSNLSFISRNGLFTGSSDMEIYNIRTLIDFGGLAILYAYHVQSSRLRLRQELDSIDMVLHNQYAQYQQSRESIELINHKYHDLKHQIAALRAEPDAERRGGLAGCDGERHKNL